MSIRATFLLIAASLAVLLAGILSVVVRLVENQQALVTSETLRHESYQLANELQQSSDDLTRMARTYAVTGDPRYEEWFRSILAIRNGEAPRPVGYGRGSYWAFVTSAGAPRPEAGETVALEDLMRAMEFSEAELDMLQQAQQGSDSLAIIEEQAMAAVKGLFADGDGEYAITGKPDYALAQLLLHNDEYHRAKATILAPIDDFLGMVEERTTRELEELRAEDRHLANFAIGLVVAAIGIAVLTILQLQRRVIRPVAELAQLARDVESGNYSRRLDVRGRDEVASLARAFNVMSAGVERDFAERARLAAIVEESELKYRRIFETTADGYVRSRLTDGRIIDVNPAAAKVLGYPSVAALLEKSTPDLYASPEDRAVIVGRLKERNEFEALEIDLLRMDGSRVTLILNGRVLPDEQGQPTFMEATFFDITSQRDAQAAIEEAREAAEKASRAKSAFLANMSHELRTPMNAIIGYSEMLLEDAEDEGNEETASDLRKIRSAGNHLLALINDVLDLSKIEAGKMDLHLETFEIPAMIDDVVTTIDSLVEKNQNTLRIEVEPDLGAMRADLTKVRQALFNLLSNAAKFTHEGEIRLDVAGETQDGAPWVRLSVTDSGIGIASDKIDHIFEAFSQADDTTTRDYGGTGLGLPISRRFCRMMGGDLSVESSANEGSTFTIRLPAHVRLGDNEASAPSASSAVLAPASTTDVERTVLVIDDDPNALDLIGRALQAEGLRVVTTSDGREAVRLAKTLRPAAITLDVIMPGMDGWQVLRELKQSPETRLIPVIMVTMTDDREIGYSLGATEFLTKPVERSRLIDLLGRLGTASAERHALVVDDQAENREMLRRVLEQEGWRVDEAEHGRSALDRLQADPPSLILLDLMMPVMDGFEFVMETRKVVAWRDIPIVVVTAKDLTEAERRQLNGDVVGLIQRSGMERDSLLAQIREHVAAVGDGGPKADG